MQDGAEEQEEDPAGEARRRGGVRTHPAAGHGPPRRPAGSVAPRRRPPPAGGARANMARAIGLVATLMLLGVGVAILLTVTRDGGDSERETFAATPTATPKTPARERKAKGPRRPRLTNAQRASRDAAVAQMRTQGYEPAAAADYKPGQSLRVLIGKPRTSTGGLRGRRAFFFVREQYIGTDATSPSLRLRVASQRGNEITLAYKRYAVGDKLCCPSDGTVKVRFALTGGRLAPRDAIPPAASRLPPAS